MKAVCLFLLFRKMFWSCCLMYGIGKWTFAGCFTNFAARPLKLHIPKCFLVGNMFLIILAFICLFPIPSREFQTIPKDGTLTFHDSFPGYCEKVWDLCARAAQRALLAFGTALQLDDPAAFVPWDVNHHGDWRIYIYGAGKCEGIEISWVEFVNQTIFFQTKVWDKGFFRKTAREMAYHQHWLEGMQLHFNGTYIHPTDRKSEYIVKLNWQ